MPTADLCTEEEITWMVHAFYARVREDEVLGPIFGARISDWDSHLAKMVDFWSGALRGTARYRGTPMPKHVVIPGLEAATFERWLDLFRQTTRDMENTAMRDRAQFLAGRIAQSLWYGCQMYRKPGEVLPTDLQNA